MAGQHSHGLARDHAHGLAHKHGHGHPQDHHHDHGQGQSHDHLHGPSARPSVQLPQSGRPAVTLRDVTVSYRGHPAVHHLSGAFSTGTLTAVVGPNGAGKSSLLAALAGMLGGTPGSGVQGRIERAQQLRVAYLPQAAALDRGFPLQVQELVATGLWAQIGSFGAVRAAHREALREALAAVGLSGFEKRLLGELSVGQLQRVLFARLLVQDAGLILLDEPFNAIDSRTTADLLGLLQRWRGEQRTVVAVLHDIEQVRAHFDHTLLLAREPVAWGPTAQVLRAEHLFKARQMAEAWDDAAADCHGLGRAA